MIVVMAADTVAMTVATGMIAVMKMTAMMTAIVIRTVGTALGHRGAITTGEGRHQEEIMMTVEWRWTIEGTRKGLATRMAVMMNAEEDVMTIVPPRGGTKIVTRTTDGPRMAVRVLRGPLVLKEVALGPTRKNIVVLFFLPRSSLKDDCLTRASVKNLESRMLFFCFAFVTWLVVSNGRISISENCRPITVLFRKAMVERAWRPLIRHQPILRTESMIYYDGENAIIATNLT